MLTLIVVIGIIALKLKFKVVMVSGRSMCPTLVDGDILLADKLSVLKEDDIVILKDPSNARRILVKRIVVVNCQGVWVMGDNTLNSRDSRDFGYVDEKNVIGRVIKVWER